MISFSPLFWSFYTRSINVFCVRADLTLKLCNREKGLDPEDAETDEDEDSGSEESEWEEVDESMACDPTGGGGRSRQITAVPKSFSLFGGRGSVPSGGLFGSTSAPAPAAPGAPAPRPSAPPPPPPPAFGQAQQQQQQPPVSQFSLAPQAPVDHRAARERSSKMLQKQFKPVDLTKEMAETYYCERQDIATESSKTDVNAFWLDFVEWEETRGRSFLSQVKRGF